MPASRWQTSFDELFRWMEDADDDFLSGMVPSMISRFQGGKSKSDSDDSNGGTKYPETLPILPLRGVVVYPHTAVPLTVGQPRSIRLVDDVVSTDKLVGLVTALNPELETPGPADLYRVGTIATIHRLLRAPDGTVRLLVQGIERFRLGDFVEEDPFLRAKIELAPEKVEDGLEIDALARNARDQFHLITQMIPSFPEDVDHFSGRPAANSLYHSELPAHGYYGFAGDPRARFRFG